MIRRQFRIYVLILMLFMIAGTSYATEITSWAELAAISSGLAGDYVLMNDLGSGDAGYDTYASSSANGGVGWLPLGSLGTQFTGTFDGQGHTISNLFIDRSGNDVGLFGCTSADSEISNVGLVDVNITGDFYVGGIVGNNKGTITNCYSTGSITGDDGVGGLVGLNFDTITNCYSTVNVVESETYRDGYNLGGLAGYNSGTITNCYSTGGVDAGEPNDVGGFVGLNGGTITNCGWYNHAGNPDYPIGSNPEEEITYEELDNTVFYDKTHNIYDTQVPYWDFTTPIWYEWASDYPRFTEEPAAGNIKKISGVAWASVKKVAGVAVANIKKILNTEGQ